MEKVLVLLATYNGEAYVREMVDSVLNQENADLHIVLSDDNSKDSTPEILAEYADKYPDKITHYRSGKRFGNAQGHFMHLLQTFHDAPYMMFCDQDDVWHKDKVAVTLKRMKEIEADSKVPALVHTDLRVVDRELNEIAPSFCKNSGLDGNRMALHQLLVQNVVTGCTMMINRALAELACDKAPTQMMMHDWWLALVATSVGQVGFLDRATIDYRQHGNNTVGAKNVYSPGYLWTRLRSKSLRQSLQEAAGQAEAFCECFGEMLSPEQRELVAAFAKTKDAGLFERNRIYHRYQLYKNGWIRVVAQVLGW